MEMRRSQQLDGHDTMKRFAMLTLAAALFAPVAFSGCTEEPKAPEKPAAAPADKPAEKPADAPK